MSSSFLKVTQYPVTSSSSSSGHSFLCPLISLRPPIVGYVFFLLFRSLTSLLCSLVSLRPAIAAYIFFFVIPSLISFQYPLVSLRSLSIRLRLLPPLPVASILPAFSRFLKVMHKLLTVSSSSPHHFYLSFNKFLKAVPTQDVANSRNFSFILCRISLYSLTLRNTSSVFT